MKPSYEYQHGLSNNCFARFQKVVGDFNCGSDADCKCFSIQTNFTVELLVTKSKYSQWYVVNVK